MADASGIINGDYLQDTTLNTSEKDLHLQEETMNDLETDRSSDNNAPPIMRHELEDNTPKEEGGNEEKPEEAYVNKSEKEGLGASIVSASELEMSISNGGEEESLEQLKPLSNEKSESDENGDQEKQTITVENETDGFALEKQVTENSIDSTTHENEDGTTSLPSSEGNSDWIDVLGNGGLLKKVLRNGEGVSTRPSAQCQVRMRVRGVLVPPPRKVVDRHNSLSFTVGDGDVIQAIDIVSSLMEKGEVCQVMTDHRFAYGTIGRSPDIPPNSSLVYDLELLEIKSPLDFSSISEKELLIHLNKKRGRGNDLFQRKEFSLAVHSYSRAVNMMRNYQDEQSIKDLSSEMTDLWIRCLNNLAAAQLKIEMYDEALESVLSVLRVDPVNVKALYRCGKVYLIKGELDDAIKNLQMAANLNPEEKAIHAELQKALRKRDQEREQERALYKRMMTGGSRSNTGSRQTSPKPQTTKPSSSTPSSSSSLGWKAILLGVGVTVAAVGIGFLVAKYRK